MAHKTEESCFSWEAVVLLVVVINLHLFLAVSDCVGMYLKAHDT